MNKFDSVVFDVDSTLVSIEGLDYLAKLKGLENQLTQITKLAMNGDLSMRDAMVRKMSALSPSIDDLTIMGNAYTKNLVPGVIETIKILQLRGIKTWIITGNFQPAVGILAEKLSIPLNQIICNKIFHDINGNYLGFDTDNPLSNNMGKRKIIEDNKDRLGETCFVGDGNTDLETRDVVDLFIGFGGVVLRKKVKELSDTYVESPDISAILEFIL